MGWLSILLMIISNLPEIIALVKEILDLIGKLRDKRVARKQFSLLRYNIRNARETRDFSGLEKQLCWLKDNCDK